MKERVRVIQRGVSLRGKRRDEGSGPRVHWRETDGGTMQGSCSKPRPVRLADFMTMAET